MPSCACPVPSYTNPTPGPRQDHANPTPGPCQPHARTTPSLLHRTPCHPNPAEPLGTCHPCHLVGKARRQAGTPAGRALGGLQAVSPPGPRRGLTRQHVQLEAARVQRLQPWIYCKKSPGAARRRSARSAPHPPHGPGEGNPIPVGPETPSTGGGRGCRARRGGERCARPHRAPCQGLSRQSGPWRQQRAPAAVRPPGGDCPHGAPCWDKGRAAGRHPLPPLEQGGGDEQGGGGRTLRPRHPAKPRRPPGPEPRRPHRAALPGAVRPPRAGRGLPRPPAPRPRGPAPAEPPGRRCRPPWWPPA